MTLSFYYLPNILFLDMYVFYKIRKLINNRYSLSSLSKDFKEWEEKRRKARKEDFLWNDVCAETFAEAFLSYALKKAGGKPGIHDGGTR